MGSSKPSWFSGAVDLFRQIMKTIGEEMEAAGYGEAEPVIQECREPSGKEEVGCADEDGYLASVATKYDIDKSTDKNKLEKGDLKEVEAIILHRTAGSTKESALNSFKSSGIGTHFLIAKDGAVLQTASLGKYTYHIGKIRSRCQQEGNCDSKDAEAIKKIGWNPSGLHAHEQKKSYPDRYPVNSESVGIEVVGAYDSKSKSWDEPTAEQKKSIRSLVDKLKKCYHLGDGDIFEHDKISYKKEGEGAGLYGD